jgi:hypothetical protein
MARLWVCVGMWFLCGRDGSLKMVFQRWNLDDDGISRIKHDKRRGSREGEPLYTHKQHGRGWIARNTRQQQHRPSSGHLYVNNSVFSAQLTSSVNHNRGPKLLLWRKNPIKSLTVSSFVLGNMLKLEWRGSSLSRDSGVIQNIRPLPRVYPIESPFPFAATVS